MALTITADGGTYAVSGAGASLIHGRLIAAAAGSYSIAGTAAALVKGKPLKAKGGIYAVAGSIATLLYSATASSRIVYSNTEKLILEGGACRYAGLIRIATPTPVRLWTGPGDLPVDNSNFDADGAIYQGAGRLIGLPEFQRLINGIAERVSVTLNGVTDDMRAIVYDLADDVHFAAVRLGLVIFDDAWAQVGPVRWLKRGRIDTIETDNRPGPGATRLKSIELSVGSFFTGRKVGGQGTWTNADQQSRSGSSDDRFCERTPLLNHWEKSWPNL
jgi:hypothetical protein